MISKNVKNIIIIMTCEAKNVFSFPISCSVYSNIFPLKNHKDMHFNLKLPGV